MSTKITRAIRNAVHQIIEDSNKYRAGSETIHRNGDVTAEYDFDKVPGRQNQNGRFLVGHVDQMVSADGAVQFGW